MIFISQDSLQPPAKVSIVRRSSGSITIRSKSGGVEVDEIKAPPAGAVIEIKNTFNPSG